MGDGDNSSIGIIVAKSNSERKLSAFSGDEKDKLKKRRTKKEREKVRQHKRESDFSCGNETLTRET
jgi:hypothetical protein